MIPADTEQYDFQPIHVSDEHGLILFYRIRFGREKRTPLKMVEYLV